MYAHSPHEAAEMTSTPQKDQLLSQKNGTRKAFGVITNSPRKAFGEITNSPLKLAQVPKPVIKSAKRAKGLKTKSMSIVADSYTPVATPVRPTNTNSFTPHHDEPQEPETPQIKGNAPGKMMASMLAKSVREAPASKTRILIDTWKMNAGNKGPHDQLREVTNAFAHTPSKAAMQGKVALNKKRLSQLSQQHSLSSSLSFNQHQDDLSQIIEKSNMSVISEENSLQDVSTMTHISSASMNSPRQAEAMEWDDALVFDTSDVTPLKKNSIVSLQRTQTQTPGKNQITPMRIIVKPNKANVSTNSDISSINDSVVSNTDDNNNYNDDGDHDNDNDDSVMTTRAQQDEYVEIIPNAVDTTAIPSTEIEADNEAEETSEELEKASAPVIEAEIEVEPSIVDTIQVLRQDIEAEYKQKLSLEIKKKEEEIEARIQKAIDQRLSVVVPALEMQMISAKPSQHTNVVAQDIEHVSASTNVSLVQPDREYTHAMQALNARLTMTKHYITTMERNLHQSITGRPSKNAVRYAVDTMAKLGAYTHDANMIEQKINLLAQDHYGAEALAPRFFSVEQRSSELAEHLATKLRADKSKAKAKAMDSLTKSTAAALATAHTGEALMELERTRRTLAKNESIRRKQAKIINEMKTSLQRSGVGQRNTTMLGDVSMNETLIGDSSSFMSHTDASLRDPRRSTRGSQHQNFSSFSKRTNVNTNQHHHHQQQQQQQQQQQRRYKNQSIRFSTLQNEEEARLLNEALAVSFC